MNPISLLSPYKFGALPLRNRMVMAPMTRCRAGEGNVPGPLNVTYYTQRATAGLIVSEGSQVSPQGVGFSRTPGIHSAEQVAGWKKVTAAVHQAGGRIFLQLWHVGRMSHPDYLGGELPVAPSSVPVGEEIHTPMGKKMIQTPHALTDSEITGTVIQFGLAAKNAKEAGFDGVEIHGANGYLLDQFLRDGSNRRTDAYGGSRENRMRFPLEVVDAVVDVWGPARVGYRISPHFSVHGMSDSDTAGTFLGLVMELDLRGIGYIHLIEAIGGRMGVTDPDARLAPMIRSKYNGTLVLNGGYGRESGNEVIESGVADLVSFGVTYLANPDLPKRFERNAPLNPEDISTFYAGEDKGYTDYPALL